jgi:hypothetical protein
VTEDAVEKPLANVGLVRTVTKLRGFRQDIIDERAGVAGADVVLEENGAPALLVIRVKVVADRMTEIELVTTRSLAEGLSFTIDALNAPSEEMNYVPRPEQLATREDALNAALKYPEGLNSTRHSLPWAHPSPLMLIVLRTARSWRVRSARLIRLREHLNAISLDLHSPRRRADARHRCR